MRTRIAIAAPLVLALALVTAGCSKNDSGGGTGGGEGGGTPVTIKGFAFDPNALSGTAGGTLEITLTNQDSVEHNFTLDDDSVSQDVEAGGSEAVQVTLPESGSIGWHCKYHSQMTGTITVG